MGGRDCQKQLLGRTSRRRAQAEKGRSAEREDGPGGRKARGGRTSTGGLDLWRQRAKGKCACEQMYVYGERAACIGVVCAYLLEVEGDIVVVSLADLVRHVDLRRIGQLTLRLQTTSLVGRVLQDHI